MQEDTKNLVLDLVTTRVSNLMDQAKRGNVTQKSIKQIQFDKEFLSKAGRPATLDNIVKAAARLKDFDNLMDGATAAVDKFTGTSGVAGAKAAREKAYQASNAVHTAKTISAQNKGINKLLGTLSEAGITPESVLGINNHLQKASSYQNSDGGSGAWDESKHPRDSEGRFT